MAGPNLIAIGSSESAQKALKVNTKLCSSEQRGVPGHRLDTRQGGKFRMNDRHMRRL